jgi:hypothetical protein
MSVKDATLIDVHQSAEQTPASDGPCTADWNDQPRRSSPEDVARAEAFERQIKSQALAQFKRLKDDAQAIYGITKGVPGVRSPKECGGAVGEIGG